MDELASNQVTTFGAANLMNDNNDKSFNADKSEPGPAYALQALNSCPGLLCFVVDRNSVLLYSTRGYKEVVKRFLSHECTIGLPYPVSIDTPFDLDLQELIQAAFQGSTAVTDLVETGGSKSRWIVTGAPLVSSTGDIVGAIVSLTPTAKRGKHEHSQLPPPPANSTRKSDEAGPDTSGLSQTEFLDTIPRMFFIMDDNARFVDTNANFLSVLKLARDEIVGHSFDKLLLENDPTNENVAAYLARAVRGESFDSLECKIASKDGDILSLELKGTRMLWEGKSRMLISCVDNTRLRRTEEQLKRVSTTDASMGTLNRQGMERALSMEMEHAIRFGGHLSMIMLDVDGFRKLNEQLGYFTSDKILRDMAAAIKSRIPLTDVLGRWGGDEFIVLTPLPLAEAVQLAEKLRDMVQNSTFEEDTRVTFSAGVSEFHKSMDTSSFAGAAFDAMIEAKKRGGNRVAQAQKYEIQIGKA